MKKILFATDLHLRATNPVSRIDADFFETQLEKIDRLRMFASSEKPDFVILGGDIVDRPDVPPSVIIRAIRAFKEFKQPVYTVVGNHDIYGYNDVTLKTSALGVLFESGALRKLDRVAIPGLVIKGLHAYDKTDWNIELTEEEHPDRTPVPMTVLVAHKFLTTMPIPNDDFYLVDTVDKESNVGIILSGDIHQPHCVKTSVGRWFVNPGSMSRMSVDDRNRIPQCAVITIDGYETKVEMLRLTTTKGSEVFDEDAYAERIAGEAHSKEFVRKYVGEIVGAKGKVAEIGPTLLAYAAANAGTNPDVTRVLTAALERAEKAVLKESEE